MNRAFLSISSNILPEENILKAIELLFASSRVLTVSRCFVTEAIFSPDHRSISDPAHYINCVVLLETSFRAREFKHQILRPLERALGRIRTQSKYAPRPIDLDLLLFNEEMHDEDGLTIPDPDIFTRWFLAQGILDIDDRVMLPNALVPLRTQLASHAEMLFPENIAFPENRQLRENILVLIESALKQISEVGPVALITGSSQRLGAQIASTLHARGMRVVVHYRHSEAQARILFEALESKRHGSVLLVAADLASPEAPREIIDMIRSRWGRLDLLVNNAAVFYPTPLEQSTFAQWDEMNVTNLRAPYFLSQAALPLLREQSGSIINIVDVYAERPRPDYAMYCATKAGLVALTRALARELAPTIRVNAIAPGAILWSSDSTAGSQHDVVVKTPLGRLGSVEDISRTVCYLIDAPYVTGQILNVDGGRSIAD